MATITMEANKVIKAAQAVIDSILKARAEEDQETRDAMRKKMYTIKWLPFPRIIRGVYTEAEVEKAIMDADHWSGWYYPSSRYGNTLAHARKLLTIAKHGDPVILNEKDTDVLFGD